MALDMTSFDAGLKQHYTRDRIENMVYSDNPFLALVPKMEKFGGRNLPLPITYGNPQGRSATFATAQANKGNSLVTDFILTRKKDYSLASIDNETIDASKGDSNAFMDAATLEIDGAFQSIQRSLATKLFRDGSGTIGRINATVTGTTLTLVEPNDIVNFEVNMKIQFSSAGTSATLRDSGDTIIVNSIDRAAGTMVLAENLNTITGIAENDYINIEGDIEGAVSGLDAWLPSSAPGSTAFFGVDRSIDSVRLGGVRYDGSALPVEEALIEGANRIAREGGRPTHCFVNFEQFTNIEKALGSKVNYVQVGVKPEISFKGIAINGPRGVIQVVPDHNCLSDVAFMLQLDTWKLYSLGMAPKLLDSDGLKMLREASSDAVEVRVGYYAQLGCRAPGWNGRITLPS